MPHTTSASALTPSTNKAQLLGTEANQNKCLTVAMSLDLQSSTSKAVRANGQRRIQVASRASGIHVRDQRQV